MWIFESDDTLATRCSVVIFFTAFRVEILRSTFESNLIADAECRRYLSDFILFASFLVLFSLLFVFVSTFIMFETNFVTCSWIPSILCERIKPSAIVWQVLVRCSFDHFISQWNWWMDVICYLNVGIQNKSPWNQGTLKFVRSEMDYLYLKCITLWYKMWSICSNLSEFF